METKKEKTKLGKFLQGLGNVGVNVVRGISEGKSPISSILGAVAGGSMSKEDADLALKLHQEDLKDVQNARNNETLRDQSEFAGFLSKNIHEIIALFVIASWVITWFVKSVIPPTEITGAVMLILGYLYGRTKPQT